MGRMRILLQRQTVKIPQLVTTLGYDLAPAYARFMYTNYLTNANEQNPSSET
jgi:hypothetical protein